MSRISTIIFVLVLCIASIVYTSACGPNAVYTACASPCALTCKNYLNPPKICAQYCIEGCKCINGSIFNDEQQCVLPSEC